MTTSAHRRCLKPTEKGNAIKKIFLLTTTLIASTKAAASTRKQVKVIRNTKKVCQLKSEIIYSGWKMPRQNIVVCAAHDLSVYDIEANPIQLIYFQQATNSRYAYTGAYSDPLSQRTYVTGQLTSQRTIIMDFSKFGETPVGGTPKIGIETAVNPNLVSFCRQQYQYNNFYICKGWVGNSFTNYAGQKWYNVDIKNNKIIFPSVVKTQATYTTEVRYRDYLFNFTKLNGIEIIKFGDFMDGVYISQQTLQFIGIRRTLGMDLYEDHVVQCGFMEDDNKIIHCYVGSLCPKDVLRSFKIEVLSEFLHINKNFFRG